MSADDERRPHGRAETSTAIESAAIELVLEHGYDNVTVDMIARVAGISPRTFFNYFKTKDAAVLGTIMPSIDERRAREFLLSSGPLLAEAVGLVQTPFDGEHPDPLLVRRFRAIISQPDLVARQMERLSVIEGELRELLFLRMRRQWPQTPEAVVRDEAKLAGHLLAGVLRYMGERTIEALEAGQVPPSPEDLTAVISAVVTKVA